MVVIILLIIIILILCPVIIVPFLLTVGIITVSIYEVLVPMFWVALISAPFVIYYLCQEFNAQTEKDKKELAKFEKDNIIPKIAVDEFKKAINEKELDFGILFYKATGNNNVPEYLEDVTFNDFKKVRDYLNKLNIWLFLTTKEILEQAGLTKVKKTKI